MIILLTLTVGALVGFVAGSVYEGCRSGGTIDLHLLLAQATPLPSNVRVLPVQRTAR